MKRGRRDFLKAGGVSVAAAVTHAMGSTAHADVGTQAPSATDARAVQEMMPTRNLGKTGFRVGIFGLGGQGALERGNNEAVALPLIERALQLGVNYYDTSAIYGGPERWSEQYLGKALKGCRGEVFIASKTKERMRDAALRNLEVSLKLLNTDHLDSWQLHDVGISEDVETIFGKGGAIEAFTQARALAPYWERARWSDAFLLPRIARDDGEIGAALRRFDERVADIAQDPRLSSDVEREAAFDAATSVMPFNLHYLPGDHTARQCRYGDLVARAVRASYPRFAHEPTCLTAWCRAVRASALEASRVSRATACREAVDDAGEGVQARVFARDLIRVLVDPVGDRFVRHGG